MTIEGKVSMLGQTYNVVVPSGESSEVETDGVGFKLEDFGQDQSDNPFGGQVRVNGQFVDSPEKKFSTSSTIQRDSRFDYEVELNGVKVIGFALNHHE